MTENRKRSVARNVVRALVAIWLLAVIGLYVQWHRNQVRHGPVAQQITCINNLKQAGLAFRQWALDYGDRFPFNVSTNEGGTLELCAPDKDGFDTSAAWHFQVMSNELNTPRILVCTKDKARKAAKDFASLLPANATYRVRSGTNVSDSHPKEILVVCPVDGNTVYCDGRVVEGKNVKR